MFQGDSNASLTTEKFWLVGGAVVHIDEWVQSLRTLIYRTFFYVNLHLIDESFVYYYSKLQRV
jgi:hypothetical protein